MACILFVVGTSPALGDDNRVAYQLLQEGKPAQAAELFTDPAWKGVAMFRSDQWWRAAEAFVRANDADSLYNLGNAYVRLGYHALALESYLATLAIDPNHEDAQFNADLIREFLAKQEDRKGQAALTPKEREIDRLKEEQEQEKGSRTSDGNEETGEKTDADKQRRDETDQAQEEQDGHSASSGGDNASRQTKQEQSASVDNRVSGQTSARDEQTQAAGGSQTTDDDTGDPTAGKRIRLEKEQATRQWLNSIRDDPAAFLQLRITQEMNRRRAAGTLPTVQGQPW